MILHSTLRTNQALIIALMGIAGLLMALVTGNIYKHLALDNQRDNMHTLLEHVSIEKIKELSEVVNDLGLSVQQHPGFRSAFQARDIEDITAQLNNQFRQYFVTAGILDLDNLFVFDRQFQFIAGSHDGLAYEQSGELPCAEIIRYSMQRKGVDMLRVHTDLCLNNNIPLHVSIIPIGGLVPKGFLMVVSRLVHNLKPVEGDVNMPIRIIRRDEQILYESGLWPEQYSKEENLEAELILKAENGNEIVRLRILDDMKGLKQELGAARIRLIFIAGIITVIAMLIAFLFLNRSVLSPMKAILTQLQLIQEDRKNLGSQIEVRGNTDIRQLAEGFNEMSAELDELYKSLAKMAFTDPMTRLYNRAWFNELLSKCINISARHDKPFAIFVMDLNKFKPINDNYGHHVGDMVLEEVSRRMQEVLRCEDVLVRLNDGPDDNLDDEIVARMGGDEFAVLLPMAGNVADVEVVAKKLIHEIAQPIKIGENRVNVGISIGIAMYPQQGDNVDQLLRRADEAMYYAKKKGSGYAFSNVNAAELYVLKKIPIDQ